MQTKKEINLERRETKHVRLLGRISFPREDAPKNSWGSKEFPICSVCVATCKRIATKKKRTHPPSRARISTSPRPAPGAGAGFWAGWRAGPRAKMGGKYRGARVSFPPISSHLPSRKLLDNRVAIAFFPQSLLLVLGVKCMQKEKMATGDPGNW